MNSCLLQQTQKRRDRCPCGPDELTFLCLVEQAAVRSTNGWRVDLRRNRALVPIRINEIAMAGRVEPGYLLFGQLPAYRAQILLKLFFRSRTDNER